MSTDNTNILHFSERLSSLVPGNERKKFAVDIGASYESVRLWCNGSNYPNGAQLISISQHLNVSIDWLLLGNDTENMSLDASVGGPNATFNGQSSIYERFIGRLETELDNLRKDLEDLKAEKRFLETKNEDLKKQIHDLLTGKVDRSDSQSAKSGTV